MALVQVDLIKGLIGQSSGQLQRLPELAKRCLSEENIP